MKNKAFTLIELLVTIVIIGILSALIFSSYNAYMNGGNFDPFMNPHAAQAKAMQDLAREQAEANRLKREELNRR